MFQAISLNNNLIDGAINSELIKYTDSAPYCEDDIDVDLFQTIIKKYYLTSENDTIPINSGMISLVYKMKTSHDKEVIIKIKRKDIDLKLDDAIGKLLFLINILSFVPQFNLLDIPNVIKKNIYLLRQQLDFNEEVKNTLEMEYNCKNLQYIKIPKVYADVTSDFSSVIMMEYIKGVHISKLNETDYDNFAKLIMKYGFVSIINNSVTHGDLHAGNVIFIKNKEPPFYQLGLIDFGIVTRVNKDTTKLFLDVVTNMFSESGNVLAKSILDSIIEPKEVFQIINLEHRENLYLEASKIIDDSLNCSKTANQIKIYDFIRKFNTYLHNNNLKKHGLYICDDFVKLQMALAMSHGVSLCLCRNDFVPFANEVLTELFHIDLLFIENN
jgi:predicted unusual protein kinase regulating ubiquinone biosynthesis (AarF/ABC1/UbiB family)